MFPIKIHLDLEKALSRRKYIKVRLCPRPRPLGVGVCVCLEQWAQRCSVSDVALWLFVGKHANLLLHGESCSWVNPGWVVPQGREASAAPLFLEAGFLFFQARGLPASYFKQSQISGQRWEEWKIKCWFWRAEQTGSKLYWSLSTCLVKWFLSFFCHQHSKIKNPAHISPTEIINRPVLSSHSPLCSCKHSIYV